MASLTWATVRLLRAPTSAHFHHYSGAVRNIVRDGDLARLVRQTSITNQISQTPKRHDDPFPAAPLHNTNDLAKATALRQLQRHRLHASRTDASKLIDPIDNAEQRLRNSSTIDDDGLTTLQDEEAQRERDERQTQLHRVAHALEQWLPHFFTGTPNYSFCHQDIEFENRIRRTYCKGIGRYVMQLLKYRMACNVMSAKPTMKVIKITEHLHDMTVRVRWQIELGGGLTGILLRVYGVNRLTAREGKGQPRRLDGFSWFHVSAVDGLVHKHVVDRVLPDDNEAPVIAKTLKEKLAAAAV